MNVFRLFCHDICLSLISRQCNTVKIHHYLYYHFLLLIHRFNLSTFLFFFSSNFTTNKRGSSVLIPAWIPKSPEMQVRDVPTCPSRQHHHRQIISYTDYTQVLAMVLTYDTLVPSSTPTNTRTAMLNVLQEIKAAAVKKELPFPLCWHLQWRCTVVAKAMAI